MLLLNTTLTVRAGAAASHQGKGWETFTDEVIRAVNHKDHPVVFILWGSHARRKKALLDSRHVVIESAHPSPLSAHNGFFGSKPFSRTNAALEASRTPPDRLAPLTPTVRTSSGRYEPTSIKRLARLRISVTRQCRTRRPILVPSVDTDDVSS